jgi:hypothetical protein
VIPVTVSRGMIDRGMMLGFEGLTQELENLLAIARSSFVTPVYLS